MTRNKIKLSSFDDKMTTSILDSIVKKYGHRYINHFKIDHVIDDIIKKNKLECTTKELLKHLFNFIGKQENKIYKNITLSSFNDEYSLIVFHNEPVDYEISKINPNIKSFVRKTFLFFFLLPIYYFFSFAFFDTDIIAKYINYIYLYTPILTISIIALAIFHKNIKIIYLIGPIYLFFKTFLTLLNDKGLFFYPYHNILDLNIILLSISVFILATYFIMIYFNIKHNEYMDKFEKTLAENKYDLDILVKALREGYSNVQKNKVFFENTIAYLSNAIKKDDVILKANHYIYKKQFFIFSFFTSILFIMYFFTNSFIEHNFSDNNNGECKFLDNNIKINKYNENNDRIYILTNEKDDKVNEIYKITNSSFNYDSKMIKINKINNSQYIYDTICYKNIKDPKKDRDEEYSRIKNTN